MRLVNVFDHHDLKHARQADHRCCRHRNQGQPAVGLHLPSLGLDRRDLVDHRPDSAGEPPNDKDPDSEQRHQFDHRLDGNRRHNAVVLLFGVQIAGAEQNGEERQPCRDPQGNVLMAGQKPRLWRVLRIHPGRPCFQYE